MLLHDGEGCPYVLLDDLARSNLNTASKRPWCALARSCFCGLGRRLILTALLFNENLCDAVRTLPIPLRGVSATQAHSSKVRRLSQRRRCPHHRLKPRLRSPRRWPHRSIAMGAQNCHQRLAPRHRIVVVVPAQRRVHW